MTSCTLPDMTQEHEARLWNFIDEFGHYDRPDDTIEVCLDYIQSICAALVGEEEAAAGIDTMVASYFNDDVQRVGWMEALKDNSSEVYSELPLGIIFHDLQAYGDYGIVVGNFQTEADREDAIRMRIKQARAFIKSVPLALWGLDEDYFAKIWAKSSARWKLDNDEPLTASDLAALSGRALQTIRNKMAGENKQIRGKNGLVDSLQARIWLNSHKSFLDSIWREVPTSDVSSNRPESPKVEPIFVPVGNDGSVFHSGLVRDGRFEIGSEMNLEKLSSYAEALKVLQEMEVPIWKRPTKGGVWTNVRGVSWRRVTEQELNEISRRTD